MIKAPDYNPFSPFKVGPGRRTLRDDYLAKQRDAVIYSLESLWTEIGWDLEHAQQPEDILKAFQKVASRFNSGPLALFLRASCEPATSNTIEETREKLSEAVRELTHANQQCQEQLRLCEEADRAVFTVGETYKKQLEDELKWRRTTVRGLKIQITSQRAKIRKVQLQLKNRIRQGKDAEELDVPALEEGLGRLEKERDGEKKLCAEIQERVRLISPRRWKIAREEATTRKARLTALEQIVAEASKKERALEEKLLDQQAYFFRTQLFKFIHDKRYARDNALSLANAIAGLPYITCRQSAARCAKLKCKITPALSSEVFEFVRSVWERRDSKGKLSLADWFRQKIAELPRTRIEGGEKRDNFLRKHLADNWGYLRRGIEESEKSNAHPRATPYEIARNFQKNSRTSDSIERILAEREKIID